MTQTIAQPSSGALLYSTEQIKAHVIAWQTSGLTKKAYSGQHGIKYGTFKGWVQKHLQLKEDIVQGDPSSFVALHVDKSVRPGGAPVPFMEITLSNGSHLSFYQAPPMEYIRELLK